MKKTLLAISALFAFAIAGQLLTVHAAAFPPAVGGTGTIIPPNCGQVLIGNASNTYTPAYILAGTNSSISTSSCAITISSTGSAITISPVAGASTTFSVIGDGTFFKVTNPSGNTIEVQPATTSIAIWSNNGLYLIAANNLSDLTNTSTARTNLGLGTAALQSSAYFLVAGNNLSDLTSTSSARTNIGYSGVANQITISASGAIGFATTSISQFVNNSGYLTGNQTITLIAAGDATGTATGTTSITHTITITGLEGKALPTLATGSLVYSGGSWQLILPYNLAAGAGVTSTVSGATTTVTLNLGTGCTGSNFVQTISATGTITCAVPTGGASSTSVFGTGGITVVQVGVNATASLNFAYSALYTALEQFGAGVTVNGTTTLASTTNCNILNTNASGTVGCNMTTYLTAALQSINGNSNSAQTFTGGSGISVASSGGNTTTTNTGVVSLTGSGCATSGNSTGTISLSVTCGNVTTTAPFSAGYIPLATSSNSLSNSTIYQTSTGSIGVNTTNPLSAFEVQASSSATSTTGTSLAELYVTNTNSSTNDNTSGISFRTLDASSSDVSVAKIVAVAQNHTAGGITATLAFVTKYAGTIYDVLDIGTSSLGSITQNYGTASFGTTTVPALTITGLASSGNPCLDIGSGGGVATSTCGSANVSTTAANTIANEIPYWQTSGSPALAPTSTISITATGVNVTGTVAITATTTVGATSTANPAYQFTSNPSTNKTYIEAGTSTVSATVGGTLAYSASSTGNGAAASTTIETFTIPTSTLLTLGDEIDMYFGGTYASTAATNKQIQLVMGGNTIFSTGSSFASSSVAANWYLETRCMLVTTITTTCISQYTDSYGSAASDLSGSAGNATFNVTTTQAINITLYGNGTNASDTVADYARYMYTPF